jgi:hypothetical protein
MITAMRNPEHALDRTHGAADAGPDCTTYDSANRASDPVTLIGAFLRAPHNALSVSCVGHGHQRQRRGGNRKRQPERQA